MDSKVLMSIMYFRGKGGTTGFIHMPDGTCLSVKRISDDEIDGMDVLSFITGPFPMNHDENSDSITLELCVHECVQHCAQTSLEVVDDVVPEASEQFDSIDLWLDNPEELHITPPLEIMKKLR